MASFFEKLIGGQAEETPAKETKTTPKIAPKPIKKTVKTRLTPTVVKEPEEPIKSSEPEIIEEEPEEEPREQKPKKEPLKAAISEEKPFKKIFRPLKETRAAEPPMPNEWPASEGQLAIDVYQTDDEIVVQSALGGVKPDEIEVTIENDMVKIFGSRQKAQTINEDNYLIQECHWGSFSRQFVLPTEVDSSRAEAILKDGILTIKIPKIQKEKTRRLEIHD
jgi:HSP20 family protein